MAKTNVSETVSVKRTAVLNCSRNCKNSFQDREYSGKRLHNAMGTPVKGWRCTVCLNEKGAH